MNYAAMNPVMAGQSPSADGRLSTPFVPAIHTAPARIILGYANCGAAWMPGTRPGMTREGNDERERSA
jgi:hypothetical protein